MYTREINEIAIKLNSVMNSIDLTKLSEFANEIESAILSNNMLEEADKQALRQSFNPETKRYQINPTDKEIVKNAKATINLLRSLDSSAASILQPTVEKLIEVVQSGSNLSALSSAASLAKQIGINSLWTKAQNLWSKSPETTDAGQIMQLYDDAKAFYLYTKQLGNFAPNLSTLQSEPMRALTSIQNAFENRNIAQGLSYISASDAVGGAHQMLAVKKPGKSASDTNPDVGISITLKTIKINVFEKINEADKNKYYDETTDRFNIPTDIKSHDRPDNINMMIAYNVTDRSRKTYNTIMNFLSTWEKTDSFPVTQVPALIELLNKLGKMVGDINNLDKAELAEAVRNDLHNGIKELLETLGPILPQLASIAQETELRAGLKDGSLLSHLKSTCDHYESLSQKYRASVHVKYPYSAQKNAIIERLSTQCDERIKTLGETKDGLTKILPDLSDLASTNVAIPMMGSVNKLPSLEQLKNLKAYAAEINTQAGNDLSSMTDNLIKAVTGMDKLTTDIAKAEREVTLVHEQLQREKNNPSFVPFDEDDRMDNALSNVKRLYEIRDRLAASKFEQHYEVSPSGVGQLVRGLVVPTKINNLYFSEGMDSISAKLHQAAKAAHADIDNLVKVEDNKKQTMQSHTAKDEKAAKLRAVGMKNESLIERKKAQALSSRRAHNIDLHVMGAMSPQEVAVAANSQRPLSKAKATNEIVNYNDTLLASILEKNQGPVIQACQKAQSTLTSAVSSHLTDAQRKLIDPSQKKDGFYVKNDNDGMIVENIKDMNNSLTRVTELMQKVNLISYHISQGDYLKILPMIPQMLKDMENLSNELAKTNQSMNNLREFFTESGFKNASAMNQIYGNIALYLPQQLLDIQGNIEVVLLTAKDRTISENVRAMMSRCTDLANNIDAFARNIKPEQVQAIAHADAITAKATVAIGSQAVGVTEKEKSHLYDALNMVASKLDARMPANMKQFKKRDSMYDLSKFKEGTQEYRIASAMNLTIIAINGCASSEGIARRSSMATSTIDILTLVLPLMKAYQGINRPEELYSDLKPAIEYLEPAIMRAYAYAALNEHALGTTNMLTSQIDQYLEKYFELAEKSHANLKGEKPYLDVQREIAATHLQHLQQKHQQQTQSLNTAKEQIDGLNGTLTDLIKVNTTKVHVSAIGSAEYETPPPTLPTLEQIRQLRDGAAAIPTHAGRTLTNMTTAMINAMTGLDSLEHDIAEAKASIAAIKEEMEHIASRFGGLDKKSRDRFASETAFVESKLHRLEEMHNELSTSNKHQHYVSANHGEGALHSGLIIPTESKNLRMGDNMEKMMENLQTAAKAASADASSMLKDSADNMKHMQNLFQVPEQQQSELASSTRRM